MTQHLVDLTSTTTLTQIKIVYAAKFRDAVGYADEWFALPDHSPVLLTDVLTLLALRGDYFQTIAESSSVFFAINEEIVTRDTQIAAGDELIIFPRVTGG